MKTILVTETQMKNVIKVIVAEQSQEKELIKNSTKPNSKKK